MPVKTKVLPAVAGGPPTRRTFLPFAAPQIDELDVAEVLDTLRSGWLVTGPKTATFERRFAEYVGQEHAVGLTSGTAAIQLGLEVAGVGPGDEVVTSPMTYVAAVHEIVRRGATPVFADIDGQTFNLDPACVAGRLGERTKALLLVHFAGRPCRMESFATLATRHGLTLISDSAHSIEARCGGRELASWFALSAFSFHPIKNLTTGEGGMITTDDREWAEELRLLRLHGVTRDAWSRREAAGAESWDVVSLGHKCNMSDVQASLGLNQLDRLEANLGRRAALWRTYDRHLADIDGINTPPPVPDGDRHAMHMYNVQVDETRTGLTRAAFSAALRAENVGTGHHYPSIHRSTYYRRLVGVGDDQLPNSARVADRIVTLPLHCGMTQADAESVIEAIVKIVEHHR